ncbi:uncharacterized protein [Dermacentor albipictus]|uniref:uncharacterized protein n=1 Tax=Dermacentor albipictus TaxID=60249 RepID=UPI0038FD0C78
MPEEGATPRAAPSSPPPYYRVPPTFGGKAGEDADEWLVHYKRVSKSDGLDATAQLTNVVFLTDTALVWYKNHEDALTTWEHFVDELKACFGDSVAKKKRAEQTLSQRAQLPDDFVRWSFVRELLLITWCHNVG